MKSILVTVALLASHASSLRLLDTPSNQTAAGKVFSKPSNATNTTNATNVTPSISQANQTASNHSLGNLTWGNLTTSTNSSKNHTDIGSLTIDVLNALNQTSINVTSDVNSTDTEDAFKIEPTKNTKIA